MDRLANFHNFFTVIFRRMSVMPTRLAFSPRRARQRIRKRKFGEETSTHEDTKAPVKTDPGKVVGELDPLAEVGEIATVIATTAEETQATEAWHTTARHDAEVLVGDSHRPFLTR